MGGEWGWRGGEGAVRGQRWQGAAVVRVQQWQGSEGAATQLAAVIGTVTQLAAVIGTVTQEAVQRAVVRENQRMSQRNSCLHW